MTSKPIAMDDPNLIAVRCRDCKLEININTGYRFISCNCFNEDEFITHYDDPTFVDLDGNQQYRTEYVGPNYIAVDGGSSYVRFIGEPDQFEYVIEDSDNEV